VRSITPVPSQLQVPRDKDWLNIWQLISKVPEAVPEEDGFTQTHEYSKTILQPLQLLLEEAA
jgi:hypothetical protein